MELKVWVEGIQRIVCGVTVNTTCQVNNGFFYTYKIRMIYFTKNIIKKNTFHVFSNKIKDYNGN